MSAGDPGSCSNLGQVGSNTWNLQMNRFYQSAEPVNDNDNNNNNMAAFHFRGLR